MLKNLDTKFYIAHGDILLNSYKDLIGEDLFSSKNKASVSINDLWNAPFALLSHGIEQEPIFNFGNKLALKLFEFELNDLIKTPSHYSSEKINQTERNKLFNEVSNHGFIKNYSGGRISSSGKRFIIEDVVIWNLSDKNGLYCGQAAMFKTWKNL